MMLGQVDAEHGITGTSQVRTFNTPAELRHAVVHGGISYAFSAETDGT